MLLGAIKFRLFGAFIGFFVGSYLEHIIENGISSMFESDDEGSPFAKPIKFTSYQNNLLILIAAVLRSNYTISRDQSYYILGYFFKQYGTKNGKALYQKLKTTIKSEVDLKTATVFMANTTQREGKVQIMTFLFGIAFIDNILLPKEKKILEDIAKLIGLSQYDFERIINKANQKKTFTKSTKYVSVSEHYRVLGVTSNSSDVEIKKAYRKLVLTYHPDRTKLDPKIAAQKFQEVQEAYDKIREAKGLK